MKNNFSKAITPETNKDWINKSEEERIEIIYKELKKDIRYEDIEIKQALKNGQIVLRTEKIIPVNERGLFFLELEEKLKLNIDDGITIWCEPVGDKSKLRNLRGVVIKT